MEKIISKQASSGWLEKIQQLRIFAPLGVFFVGVTIIILTRYVFYIFHPSYFDGRVPSISKSAAFAPGVYLFCAGTVVVCICIFITVDYVKQIYSSRIDRLMLPEREDRHLRKLCNTGALIACAAGIFLVMLSIISLEVNGDLHIILSIMFFSTQNLAFVYDFFCTRKINHYARQKNLDDKCISANGKPLLFVIITCLSLFYLFMFLFKDSSIFPDNYLAHQIYSATEYTWASLAFMYAALYYPEIKKQFG